MSAHKNLLHTLEPRYYIDPDLFRVEQSEIFAKTWQFAGHASQLEKPGDFFAFDLAGQNLFCILGDDAEIRAFYNVCQHRAHELVRGSGNCRKIVCPYHAWNYELDGRFRSGPNVKSVPGFDGSRIRLTSVRIENFHGFLFVNLDADATPMDEWYPGVRKQLADYVPQIDSLKPLEWIEVSERCNWKLSVENYSECYHCRLNHPSFSTGVVKPETYDIQPQGYCLRHTTESQNLDKMSYTIDPNANEYASLYSSWYLYPTFSFQVYPGNTLNTYQWLVPDHENVVVRRGWYTVDGKESAETRTLALQDRDTTVAEDVSLVESVQRGMHSRGYHPSPLVIDPDSGVDSEHSLRALQGWIKDAVDRS